MPTPAKPALHPLLMEAQFSERVWGTRDLRPYFQRKVEGEPVGEAWMTGDLCRVLNGPLAGRTLGELAAEFGPALTGTAAPQPERFPLLIKFLFPRQKLSVQVHPDDLQARLAGEPCGKSECWYIARALPTASIGLGLRAGINREMFRMAVEARQAEHMLNWLPVKSGEMYYVGAGTVHALGADSIVVETQQNSDTTYRLYDYGRPRQLHLEQGLAVLVEKARTGLVERQLLQEGRELLVASPHFIVERLQLAQSPLATASGAGGEGRSPLVLLPLEGAVVVECAGWPPLTVMTGECAVIPAALPRPLLRPQWSAELLTMQLPHAALAEPRTTLHTIDSEDERHAG
jgi:mannose-6-phosphate isomerase